MNFRKPLVLAVSVLVVASTGSQAVQAQTARFDDVPPNHWAFDAIRDLADKGYVDGYPNGNFLLSDPMSRYEIANVIARILVTLRSISEAGTASPPMTASGSAVSQDDLNKVQVLVDEFQPELKTIQDDITGLTGELSDIRQDIQNANATASKARTAGAYAQSDASDSYGDRSSRKFSVTGYLQTRFVSTSSSTASTFTQGLNNSLSAGGLAAAYNGTYAQGGTSQSLEVRRARIYIAGSPAAATSYQLQLDVSGAVNNYSSTNSQLTLEMAYFRYVFGNGSRRYPAVTAGQMPNPFGYSLNAPQYSLMTPERPLAFQQTSNVGLWDNQDYDKGVALAYGPRQVTVTFALLNGTGRQSENIQDHFDSVFRVSYVHPSKVISVGFSYYDGEIARSRNTGDGDTAIPYTSATFSKPKKDLVGADMQSAYSGFFADYEWVKGTYEKRSYFDANFATAGTNPLGFQVDNYIKGNQVQGSYLWAGYTFQRSGSRPLTFAGEYDTFQRSIASQNVSGNSIQSSIPVGGYPLYYRSGAEWDDLNAGYGALYNLDQLTRLRFWYEQPLAVSHAPGTPTPQRIGLYTAELQVRF